MQTVENEFKNMKLSPEIILLRCEIDALDDKILDLLNARARLSEKISTLKAEAGSAQYSPEREAMIFERLSNHSQNVLSPESVSRVFKAIVQECLARNLNLARK